MRLGIGLAAFAGGWVLRVMVRRKWVPSLGAL